VILNPILLMNTDLCIIIITTLDMKYSTFSPLTLYYSILHVIFPFLHKLLNGYNIFYFVYTPIINVFPIEGHLGSLIFLLLVIRCQERWHTFVILTFRRQRQENHEFKASLGHISRKHLKKTLSTFVSKIVLCIQLWKKDSQRYM
jgi:hypothetical protein